MQNKKNIITHTHNENQLETNEYTNSLHGLGFHGWHGEGTAGKGLGKHWVLQLVVLETLQDTNTASEKMIS